MEYSTAYTLNKSSLGKDSVTSKQTTQCSSVFGGTYGGIFELEKYDIDMSNIIPMNLCDIRLINGKYSYLIKFYPQKDDGVLYKKWFENIDGLDVNHRNQLLGRFERDLESLKSMPGLKAFSEEKSHIIKKQYRQMGIDTIQISRQEIDALVIKEKTIYDIINGEIKMNPEWHYLGKRNGDEILQHLLEEKKPIFQIDDEQRLECYRRKRTKIEHTARKLKGPVESQYHDCTPEMNEVESFLGSYMFESIGSMKKRQSSANKQDQKYVYKELDIFVSEFLNTLHLKTSQLKE